MITESIAGNILLITKKLSNWFANIPSNVLLVKKSGAKNSVINVSNSIFLNYSSAQIWFYTMYLVFTQINFTNYFSIFLVYNKQYHFILSMCLDISFSVKSQCESLSNWLPFLSTKQGSNLRGSSFFERLFWREKIIEWLERRRSQKP